MKPIRFAILTVSDRSSRGERADESGPALAHLIRSQGWEVVETQILPDDSDKLRQLLADWADRRTTDIILTTGGTGFAPRDVTPEATLAVIEREAPGLTEAMRAAGATKSAHSMLSRAKAGLRGRTLIVNLPGSPIGAIENLQVIMPALEHAVQLLRDEPAADKGHEKPLV